MLEKMKTEWAKWTRITPENALYDRALIWLFLALVLTGMVMVISATASMSSQGALHFMTRAAGYAGIAVIVCILCSRIPMSLWEQHHSRLLLLSLVLLASLFFVGKEINGSTRWIMLGPVQFQPSELAKLALICYFSGFYVRKFEEIRQQKLALLRPFSVVLLFSVFLLNQPDLGSTTVIFMLMFAMLFIVGAKLFQFFLLGLVGIAGFITLAVVSEYRFRRITSFMDPFEDFYGEGYQLSNSLMGFSQGGFLGRGLGNSIQKTGFLPEAHTDFIMAVIGEELGFVGILLMIFLLLALTFRALKISRESLQKEKRFAGFFSFGIAVWIMVQGFVNLGVASGLLPTKGLTFPFVSFGGSSLVMMSVAMAILLRIDYENRLENLGSVLPKQR